MKTINFKPEMIGLIKQGKKTKTSRPMKFDKNGRTLPFKYEVGDNVIINDSELVIKILDIDFGFLKKDAEKIYEKEGFSTEQEFLDYWHKIYAGTKYELNPPIWIYEFEIEKG